MDDESDWQRQLLIGLVVLLAVGALIGGIVAVVSIKAADLAGIDDTSPTTAQGPGGPPQGGTSSTTAGGETSSPTTPSSTDSSGTTTPTGPTSTDKPGHQGGITLIASPMTVSTYERINLTGTYQAPTGTQLQVQRKDGGAWTDFPVTATVNGGKFATYVETGRAGVNMFRIIAVGRADVSNPVSVQVS